MRITPTPPRCAHAFDIAVPVCRACIGTYRVADKPCFEPTKDWPPYIRETRKGEKVLETQSRRARLLCDGYHAR